MSIKRILLLIAFVLGSLIALFFLLTEMAAAGGWIEETAVGFGDAQNVTAFSSAVYSGRIYIGTNHANGGEIWSWDGTSWVQVVGQGAAGSITGPGFGDANNYIGDSMAPFAGYLYVATRNINGCQVYRYDGFDWERVVGQGPAGTLTGAGFGNAANLLPKSMAAYGPHLYVGTGKAAGGCEIFRTDGNNWEPVVGGTAAMTSGFGNISNSQADAMTAFGPYLYAGTYNPNGCQVWRYDGASWTAVAGGGAAIGPGFGDANNTGASSLSVYDSRLYAGTLNSNPGCEIWAYDGAAWSQVVGRGPMGTPTAPGFGNGDNHDAAAMAIYDSHLYVATSNNVWRFNGSDWSQVVGQDPAGTPGTGPGFGDAANISITTMAVFDSRIFFGTFNLNGCQVWSNKSATTWYLSEGATAGGYETWILVQNPNAAAMNITIKFQTANGEVDGPVDTIPANSRRSYLANSYVSSFDVSTKVTSNGPDIICERSMYWTPPGKTTRVLGHDSIGVIAPASRWYLAEGATKGGYETWVLVQNPNPAAVDIDMKFQTENGQVQGPIDSIAAKSRKSYLLNLLVSTYNVSTLVTSTTPGGPIICERAVYYTPSGSTQKEVGTDSIGIVEPASDWYLAEGATAGGYETWILVQNPNPLDVNVNLKYQTGDGEVQGPVETVFAGSRKSFRVNDKVTDYNVSTRVTSFGGDVVCERSMYWSAAGSSRKVLGHDCIGVRSGQPSWYLAEGSTKGGFETWVLIQNPNDAEVTVDLKFQTGSGLVPIPGDPPIRRTIPPRSRRSYKVNDWVDSYDVSTTVTAMSGAPIICERSVYWTPPGTSTKVLGTDSIGFNL
jgi:hypothetical protein